MPCSFAPLTLRRSRACAQLIDSRRLTVIVRCIPLVTAAYGTWVARPARTTTLPHGGNGFQLAQRGEAVLGDHCPVGKSPEGSRQPGGRLENPRPLSASSEVASYSWNDLRLLPTFSDRWCRCCPRFARQLRTSTDQRDLRPRPVADASGASGPPRPGTDRAGRARQGRCLPGWAHWATNGRRGCHQPHRSATSTSPMADPGAVRPRLLWGMSGARSATTKLARPGGDGSQVPCRRSLRRKRCARRLGAVDRTPPAS